MKFNSILQEASQEIVQQFNSFYDHINKTKELSTYGSLRMREVFLSKAGYVMQFQLKPEYASLNNVDEKIKYIMHILKDSAMKYNNTAKIKRENTVNNQAVIKIIFKEDNNEIK